MLAIVPGLTMCTVLGESHRLMPLILGRNLSENNDQNENRKTGETSSPFPLGMIFLVMFRSLCFVIRKNDPWSVSLCDERRG